MTFSQKRKDAGFRTQAAFAHFIGRSTICIKTWESANNPSEPDQMAVMILDAILNGVEREQFGEMK